MMTSNLRKTISNVWIFYIFYTYSVFCNALEFQSPRSLQPNGSLKPNGQLWSIEKSSGTLLYANEPFLLKGINWFGYETPCRIVHGLWIRTMEDLLKTISDYQYNALRLPFSIELIHTWEVPPLSECVGSSPWLAQLSVRDTLHTFFSLSKNLGLSILLDFHSIHHDITEYPWTDDHPQQEIFEVWTKVINEFSQYPNLLGIDIKNEPHGSVTWPLWSEYITQFIQHVKDTCPTFQGLIFVEGLQDHSSVWGGSFEDMSRDWRLYQHSNENNIVFSPHVYGVSIRGEYAMDDTFQQYDEWFGYIHQQQHALVIGEVGGWYIGDDELWEKRFLVYLLKRNITNVFYWCLNPDSADTGGIFYNDWKTPNTKKINFHETLQPYPTALIFSV